MTSELNKTTQEAIASALDRDPQKTDWGFCCFEQGPAYACNGRSHFWFKDKPTLVAFLRNHAADLIIAFDLDDDVDVAAIAQKISTIFPPDGVDVDLDQAMTTLNGVIDRYISFEWIGAFEELVSGPGKFATDLREEFRENQNESDQAVSGVAPLTKHEMADFREFLIPA